MMNLELSEWLRRPAYVDQPILAKVTSYEAKPRSDIEKEYIQRFFLTQNPDTSQRSEGLRRMQTPAQRLMGLTILDTTYVPEQFHDVTASRVGDFTII